MVSNTIALEPLSRPMTSPAATGIDSPLNVLTPPLNVSAGLELTPMNCPPAAGRRTRSSTTFPALPELTEKLVIVPSNGTCSVGVVASVNGT